MAVDAVARAIAAGKVPVDAYQMAVAGGYTGTKEQFEQDMGNSGTNAINAADSAAAAAASATTSANAAGNLAPAYSASATYAVGDHVLYDGGYYVCTTAITTAEAWTAAHWTAAKVGPEITDLKTHFETETAKIKAVTITETQETTTTDLYPDITWTNDAYIDLSGLPHTGEGYRYSDKISVNEGDRIYYTNANLKFRFITAYSDNVAVSASGGDSQNSYTVPSGIDHIVISDYTTRGTTPINCESTTTVYTNALDDDIADIQGDITDIQGGIVNIHKVVEVNPYTEETVTNIFPSITWTSGYMGTDGRTYSGDTYRYSNKIPVQEGDVIAFQNPTYTFNFITAFENDTAIPEKGINTGTNSYTVPEGINYVVLTEYVSRGTAAINLTRESTETAVYLKPIPLGYMMQKGTLANGERLTLPYMQVKNNNRIVFNANITSFESIKYVIGEASVEVNGTNLVITPSGGSALTIPHGLTISDNITLLIATETEEYISAVRVESAGDVFDYNTKFFAQSANASQYVSSTNSTLTECVLSWVSQNVNAPVWMFGDSYFAWYYNQGWTYYMAQDGYAENVMLNGYSGQASNTAYNALVNLLAITTPKIVVWCLGMNNPDNGTAYQAATAVNASWKEYYDKILELEKKYGFELVLYTTPTTPKWDNSFKDTIVRNSEHRYIEIDKAVRIDNNGNWVTGALASDDTHPTEAGAKIIYHRFLADLPDMMCKF